MGAQGSVGAFAPQLPRFKSRPRHRVMKAVCHFLGLLVDGVDSCVTVLTLNSYYMHTSPSTLRGFLFCLCLVGLGSWLWTGTCALCGSNEKIKDYATTKMLEAILVIVSFGAFQYLYHDELPADQSLYVANYITSGFAFIMKIFVLNCETPPPPNSGLNE
eukprot:NODE_5409_length_584_cov_101.930057.p1 GENE.NODE_5409_length_584_cov_101.930057~~NODE_5409_length_584_cov_101.930057.p1  ORF type:complete len:160 (+),score=11.73 NODE_5409_length_584_cov_101.930057:3-482(+)